MTEQVGLSYGDASDGDDTGSDVEDGADLRCYVPGLRENSIADTHCELREASKWRVRKLGELGHPGGRRTVRRRTMTKYEFTRIRSMRIAQLEEGALPLVQPATAHVVAGT